MSGAPVVNKLALIGIGLIGSSVAHAARRGNAASHIAVYDSSQDVLGRAAGLGFADSDP